MHASVAKYMPCSAETARCVSYLGVLDHHLGDLGLDLNHVLKDRQHVVHRRRLIVVTLIQRGEPLQRTSKECVHKLCDYDITFASCSCSPGAKALVHLHQ